MFETLSDTIDGAIKKLRSKGKLSAKDIDAALQDIRTSLIEGDVALSAADSFLERIRERALEVTRSKALNPAQQIVKIISEELERTLGGDAEREFNYATSGPTVVLLVGLQGAGKTSTAGKLAHYFKTQKHNPLLVAADLQRPGAVDQLKVVGKSAKVPVFAPFDGVSVDGTVAEEKKGLLGRVFSGRDETNRPVKAAEDAISHAKENGNDVIIVDTAGRLGVDEELMQQVKDIRSAVGADEVLFVIDSLSGQDAVNTAKAFMDGVGFTGVVLTKVDGDQRGGAALSVVEVTGAPILFATNGEKVDNIELFHPDRMASRILNLGDMMTLIEQAEQKLDEDVAEKTMGKLISGEDFDFDDFMDQMNQLKKMGSLKNLMSMVPGLAAQKQAIQQFDETEIDRMQAIVQSMSPYERANPSQINGTRRARIANGAGVHVSSVNRLLEQFKQMQKMMKKMIGSAKGGGKAPRIPGMGMAGGMNPAGAGGGLGGLLGGGLKNQLSGAGSPLSALSGADDEDFDPSALMQQGFTPGYGGNTSRKGKNNKKKKGKSGNPAKRAAEEAAHRAKFQ